MDVRFAVPRVRTDAGSAWILGTLDFAVHLALKSRLVEVTSAICRPLIELPTGIVGSILKQMDRIEHRL
jgi:hypothetical protein